MMTSFSSLLLPDGDLFCFRNKKSAGMFEIETAVAATSQKSLDEHDPTISGTELDTTISILFSERQQLHSVPQLDFLQSNNNDVTRTLAQDSGYFAYPSNSEFPSLARSGCSRGASPLGSIPHSLREPLVWRDAKYPLSVRQVRIMSQCLPRKLNECATPMTPVCVCELSEQFLLSVLNDRAMRATDGNFGEMTIEYMVLCCTRGTQATDLNLREEPQYLF